MPNEDKSNKNKGLGWIYATAVTFVLAFYTMSSVNYKTPKPWKWGEVNRRYTQENQAIDSTYNAFLEGVKTLEDSVEFYREHDLSITFEEPNRSKKKRIIEKLETKALNYLKSSSEPQ